MDYPSLAKPPSSDKDQKESPGAHHKKPHEVTEPKWPITYGFSMGANFPDMFPLAAHIQYKRSFDLRLFVSPSMPFKVHVEMPDDTIKTTKGSPVVIRTPPMTVNFDAVYGPQYGLETYYYPFDGTFFIALGASFRSLSLKGSVESNVNITTTDGSYTGDSYTSLWLAANAQTSQSVMRGLLGWRWPVYNDGFFSFLLGYTMPYHHHSQITIDSELHTGYPNIDDTINSALADLKHQKEADMESQSLKAMRPVERLALPLIGVEMGVFL